MSEENEYDMDQDDDEGDGNYGDEDKAEKKMPAAALAPASASSSSPLYDDRNNKDDYNDNDDADGFVTERRVRIRTNAAVATENAAASASSMAPSSSKMRTAAANSIGRATTRTRPTTPNPPPHPTSPPLRSSSSSGWTTEIRCQPYRDYSHLTEAEVRASTSTAATSASAAATNAIAAATIAALSSSPSSSSDWYRQTGGAGGLGIGGETVAVGGGGGTRREERFPAKLHSILIDPDLAGKCVTWLPHGRAWKILNQRDFERIALPRYFRHDKFTSFMRQVSGWGFKRVHSGPDEGAYYHELFLQGLPHISLKMRRLGGKKNLSHDDDNAHRSSPTRAGIIVIPPDFYRISERYPLPIHRQGEYGNIGGAGTSSTVRPPSSSAPSPSSSSVMLLPTSASAVSAAPVSRGSSLPLDDRNGNGGGSVNNGNGSVDSNGSSIIGGSSSNAAFSTGGSSVGGASSGVYPTPAPSSLAAELRGGETPLLSRSAMVAAGVAASIEETPMSAAASGSLSSAAEEGLRRLLMLFPGGWDAASGGGGGTSLNWPPNPRPPQQHPRPPQGFQQAAASQSIPSFPPGAGNIVPPQASTNAFSSPSASGDVLAALLSSLFGGVGGAGPGSMRIGGPLPFMAPSLNTTMMAGMHENNNRLGVSGSAETRSPPPTSVQPTRSLSMQMQLPPLSSAAVNVGFAAAATAAAAAPHPPPPPPASMDFLYSFLAAAALGAASVGGGGGGARGSNAPPPAAASSSIGVAPAPIPPLLHHHHHYTSADARAIPATTGSLNFESGAASPSSPAVVVSSRPHVGHLSPPGPPGPSNEATPTALSLLASNLFAPPPPGGGTRRPMPPSPLPANNFTSSPSLAALAMMSAQNALSAAFSGGDGRGNAPPTHELRPLANDTLNERQRNVILWELGRIAAAAAAGDGLGAAASKTTTTATATATNSNDDDVMMTGGGSASPDSDPRARAPD